VDGPTRGFGPKFKTYIMKTPDRNQIEEIESIRTEGNQRRNGTETTVLLSHNLPLTFFNGEDVGGFFRRTKKKHMVERKDWGMSMNAILSARRGQLLEREEARLFFFLVVPGRPIH